MSNAKVQIDYKKKEAVITVPLLDQLEASSTGATQSLVSIRNEPIGQTYIDGRPLKMSLQIYVKPPKV